ncbi:hypothetical protein HK096_005456, partial [Nowakowskiella sp. JEL0078]
MPPFEANGHYASAHTYMLPTLCSVCNLMLVGIIKQGLKCDYCSGNYHKNCLPNAPVCSATKIPTFDSLEADYVPIADLDALHFSKNSDTNSPGISPPISPSSSSNSHLSPNSTLNRRRKFSFNASDSPLTLLTSKKEKEKENDQTFNLPSLSVLTTSKNMTKFIPRVSALVAIQDFALEIIQWHQPSKTIGFLFLYSLMCFYPKSFFILPQLVLLYIIVCNNYLLKTHKPANTFVVSTPTSSLEYSKNMQFIQNVMGIYVDVFDTISSLYPLLDWSSRSQTNLVMGFLLGSCFLVSLVITFIPLNYIALIIGMSAIFGNTEIMKSLAVSILRVVEQHAENIQEAFVRKDFKGIVKNVVKAAKDASEVVTNSSSFATEIVAQWSDESGTIPKKLKDLIELPNEKWEWVGEWKIESRQDRTDENGWIYTDNSWQNPSSR